MILVSWQFGHDVVKGNEMERVLKLMEEIGMDKSLGKDERHKRIEQFTVNVIRKILDKRDDLIAELDNDFI